MKYLAFFCLVSLLNAAPIEEVSSQVASVGEYGSHFQGDIVLTTDQNEELFGGGRSGRTGILNTNARWPKTNGLVYVPYIIASGYYCE
jgi:hypothetical protein